MPGVRGLMLADCGKDSLNWIVIPWVRDLIVADCGKHSLNLDCTFLG